MTVTPEMESAVSDPAFCEAYANWLNNPVTLRVLELARDAAKPASLPSAKAEEALYYSGQIDAIANYENAITSMVLQVKRFVALKDPKVLQANYGALKKSGASI